MRSSSADRSGGPSLDKMTSASSLSPLRAKPVASVRSKARTPVSRVLRAAAVFLTVGGFLAVADGVITLVWQEPISAVYQRLAQDRLAGDLRQLEKSRPSSRARAALTVLDQRQRMAFLARDLQHTVRTGAAVGRIEIPRISASYVLVAGTGVGALKEGPGIYSDTSFPGSPGAVGIAGHRTTYAAPFRRLDELARGNAISVRMPYGRFIYRVDGSRTVLPGDVSVLRQGSRRLVLTTCTPRFSAAKRLVVFAHLSSSTPLGAALGSRRAQVHDGLVLDEAPPLDRGQDSALFG